MSSWIKKTTFAITAIPFSAFIVWYVVSFLSHLSELEVISAKGSESIKNLTRPLYAMAVAGETKEGIRSYAMRRAYSSLVFEKNRNGMLVWHSNSALWYYASYIHLSDRDVFGIWVECSLYGCGRGLKVAARKYFGKEMKALSERELTALLAVVKSPSIYAPGTERGEERTNQILEKSKTHNNTLNQTQAANAALAG